MDNDKNIGASENSLATLLSDKEFLARLSSVADALKTETQAATSPDKESAPPDPLAQPPSPASTATMPDLASMLSNPEIMAKLPEVMSAITPVLKGANAPPHKATHDKRTALLLALRPYLSPARCEAIDYITRIGKLGDVVKNLKL